MKLSESEIERLERALRLRSAPRPPDGLLSRILAEIPGTIAVAPARADALPFSSALGEARPLARLATLAASLLLATALALVGWEATARREGGAPSIGAGARPLVRVIGALEPTPAELSAARLVAIEVTVLGPGERPQAGALVAVEPAGDGGGRLELVTDGHGQAKAPGLTPGTYRLRCASPRDPAAGDEVTLNAGETASLLLFVGPSPADRSPLG